MIGAILTVALAACGSSTIAQDKGPFASPPVSPPARVLNRVCNAQNAADKTADTQFMRILMIRQGTDLGRVSDDLTGAVPGGNFPVDSNLALNDSNAQDAQTRIKTSNLCDPPKSELAERRPPSRIPMSPSRQPAAAPARLPRGDEWRRVDSNYRHTGYEPGALPLSYTATRRGSLAQA